MLRPLRSLATLTPRTRYAALHFATLASLTHFDHFFCGTVEIHEYVFTLIVIFTRRMYGFLYASLNVRVGVIVIIESSAICAIDEKFDNAFEIIKFSNVGSESDWFIAIIIL